MPVPSKAMFKSFILPGWGQVQNEDPLNESKELIFASFSLDADYTPKLKNRTMSGKNSDENLQQLTMLSVMPIVIGFMVAITD